MSLLSALLPAAVLLLGILCVLFADVVGRGRRPGLLAAISATALLASAVTALVPLLRGTADDRVFLAAFRMDPFALALTVFCAVAGAVTIAATLVGEGDRRPGGEFHALVLGAVLGMSVLSAATDLVTLFLAFETVSITGYVLVGMHRADRLANEASLKYVLFGAVSSGLMLYGLSWIYGLSGGTSFEALHAAVASGASAQPMFLVAVLLVFAGFAFKISAVPFHFWAPDVYQGAPSAVAGFLSVASKAAGFAALVRVAGALGTEVAASNGSFLPVGGALPVILAVAAIATMTVGNVAACRQNDLKRLLAWSSVAHAGYMLLALSVWSRPAVEALLFYLVGYLFMNLTAFLLAGIVVRATGSSHIDGLRGLGYRHPWLAFTMVAVMLSLTGIPPLLGFLGKYVLFVAVLEKGYLGLAVIGLLNGAVSLYYYLRPVARMYFDEPDAVDPGPRVAMGRATTVMTTILVVPVVALFLGWSPLLEWLRAIVPTIAGKN